MNWALLISMYALKIHQYIKSITKSNSLPSILKYNQLTVNTDLDKANVFNEYFFSVYTDNSSCSDLLHPQPPSQLADISITHDEVFQVLCSLNTKKASGSDNIGPTLLKNCASSLTYPLHHLFSLSLQTNVIPSEWKYHTIIPIFKANDKSNVKNYRPISLLSNISKVLERIVYNRTLQITSSFITHTQFGFCKSKSTLQQLLLYFNDLCSSKHPIHSIYLDYSKAFDKVSHKILLEKLWSMGINNNLWFWFQSYLTNQFQRVKINQSLSDPLPVKSGVPQGSILGPLLFLLFINDLPTTVRHSNILSFADDTKCYKVIHNILDTTLLQSDLESVFKWSIENQLLFNINKCTVLPFKSKSSSDANCYSIDNNILSSKSSHRDLGIIFSTNLSWSAHYESIISKAYRSFGLLRRVFSNSHSIKAKKNLYISIVRSNLLYCSPLWRPYLIKDILNLERIQRRASKYILGDYTSDYKTRLIKLNLLPLMYIYELLDILVFIKSCKSPINSFNIFQYVTFNNSFTRSRDN